MVEHGVAVRRVVHVVAALDRERQAVTERLVTASAQGPSATTTSRASTGPSAVATRQPAGASSRLAASPIARAPPSRSKQADIGHRQCMRIDHRPGSVKCSAPISDVSRCGSASRKGADRAPRTRCRIRAPISRRRAPAPPSPQGCGRLDPAVGAQVRRAGLLGEREVLRHAMLDQRRVFLCDRGVTRGARMPPVAREEGRKLRQRFQW